MEATAAQQGREKMQRAILDAARNRKVQQKFRSNLIRERENTEENDDIPEESRYKRGLQMAGSLLRNGVDSKAGALLGATALGAATGGVGARFGYAIGKNIGISGIKKWAIRIIIGVLIATVFSFIMLIAVVKGYCDTYTGTAADYLTLNICPSFK